LLAPNAAGVGAMSQAVELAFGVSRRARWASAQGEPRQSLPEARHQNFARSLWLVGVNRVLLLVSASTSFARDSLAERLADQVA